MILLRQRMYTSLQPSEEYIKKEIEMGKRGYGVLPKNFPGRKKDFVYFTDGDEVVGYNLFTGEEHRVQEKSKSFSKLGHRIRKAKATYLDSLDYYNDPEYLEGEKKDADAFLKSAMEKPEFDDSAKTITYPGGEKITYKDDLRYRVAKEDAQEAQRRVVKSAEDYYNSANSGKSAKRRARENAIKTLIKG